MRWFNNLKVGRKILLSSLIFVVLITGITAQGVIFGISTIDTINKFYDKEFTPVKQLDTILQNLLQIRINMLIQYQGMLRDDLTELTNREEVTKQLIDENSENYKKYKETLFSDEGRNLAREWEALSVAPEETRKLFIESIFDKRFDDATRYMNQWVIEYRALRDQTKKMIASKSKFAESDKDGMIARAKMSIAVTVVILIFSIIGTVAVTFVLSRAVSVPVTKGLVFAGKIAEGDLTGRIDLEQNDELGMLGKSLNKAADGLESLVSGVLTASQSLAQAVEQITSGNQNLSQRTSEQASALEEVASTIEEATAAINQNADNAADARKLSDESSRMAEDGGRLVGDAVSSINEINSTSKKIGEIITVINEIAFQTNLLALNASVEAARAGEQGRGFAVVAGEVRNLAQRSGAASKEITELIKNSLEMIEIGTEKANKSGEALKKIIQSTGNVGSVVAEIAEATNEQKSGINQINRAISEMDIMTQQNAALVEQTASASEAMASQSQELLSLVNQFRINDESRKERPAIKHPGKSPDTTKKISLSVPEKKRKEPDRTETVPAAAADSAPQPAEKPAPDAALAPKQAPAEYTAKTAENQTAEALTAPQPAEKPGPDAALAPKRAPADRTAKTAKKTTAKMRTAPAPGPDRTKAPLSKEDHLDRLLMDDGFEKF